MSGDSHLARLDTVALAALVRSGEISPRELVEDAIARIEALDGPVNAVIHPRFEKAIAEAEDPALPDGPFRGVPFTLKDLWPSSAGDPYHRGVRGLKEAGHVGSVDSNLVKRYREAGFVIVGRTNTPELGLSATTEPLAHGPSCNPWELGHGTGGSSGGAAAVVAAGMMPSANASDGGGSIRIPSAMCGLVGLKPSRGRVSMGPHQDEWGNSVQHAVCHTVRDSAAILDVTAEPFVGDGVIAPRSLRPLAEEVGAGSGSLRIGITTDSRSDVETHPECTAAVVAMGQTLESLGHHVETSSPAALHDDAGMPMWGMVAIAGVAANLLQLGEILGRPITEQDVESGTWFMARQADSITGTQVIQAQGALQGYRREMTSWWGGGWDLLLTPTTAQPPPPLGQLVATPDNPYQAQIGSIPYSAFTSPFNSTGQPAISLPAGFTDDGLPVGAQLVADYGREDLLIRVAAQLEAELNWADHRAPMHP